MSERSKSATALQLVKNLSDHLWEAELEEFTSTPEEEQAAEALQKNLVERLRTVPLDQWPTIEDKIRAAQDAQEVPEYINLVALGMSAP